MKELLAKAVAERVKDGELLGIGSGTTVELIIEAIGQRIKAENIRVRGLATSYRTSMKAVQQGIELVSFHTQQPLSWAFDGADEVDPARNMIKGRGGAMLSEKILARRAPKLLIAVTEEKLVKRLGEKFPVPVEVVPEALSLVEKGLKELGAGTVVLRESKTTYGPVPTEHNNLILDAWFDNIPLDYEQRIKCLIGVVESGLFIGFQPEVLVSTASTVAIF